MNVSGCQWDWPDWVFILIQLALYIPLSWVRKIKHFSLTSLIADVFIMGGLGYVLYFNINSLAHNGVGPDIVHFNWEKFPLFIGTAMFAFEGM
jgi:proton-coupled amino acid transporter